jgi:murein DD-endopeptidase MepM/ murein hydrolase activator NlpD
MHTGIDLAAPKGTPIYSAGAGVVVFAGWKNGYGNVVELDHGFGYHTLYGHSSKLLVKVGDTVGRGSVIALVGSTGNSTGCHLHYETIIDDQKINPEPFLLDASLASVKPSVQE